MKWYKAEVDLKDHPKRFELEEALGTIHGMHYIHCWFSHVGKFYETGDCSGLTPAELSRACEWKGDPQVAFDAFLKCGFIDKDLVGGLTVHNWFKKNARFLKENGKEEPIKKPVGKPRKSRGKTLLQDSTIPTVQYQDQGAPLAASPWNAFGILMEEFANTKPPVIVTERNGREIGIVNARGSKLGEEKFRLTAKAYCNDEFLRTHGLSVDGFLNAMDRLANKVFVRPTDKGDICRKEGHKPGKIVGIRNLCQQCNIFLGLV